jgi:single-strand DNA-binding protein
MINQVTLVGRITKDPDLRLTPEGTPVTNITIAVNRPFKNQQGEYEADFVQCTLWRKTAENTANFCRKGSIIGVTGKIQTRNYQNQDGKRVYITEVVGETVQFLSRRMSEEQRVTAERYKDEEWKTPASPATVVAEKEPEPPLANAPSKEWVITAEMEKEKEEANEPVPAGGSF